MNTHYNSRYIFSITLVATLGGLLFGYDTAVISGTVESLNTVFVAPQHLSESAANSLLGFCVASALIGCIIGGALGGYCSNRFGRRDSLKIAALLFFISGIGSAWPELGFTTINPDNAVPVYLAGYVPEFVIYRIIGGIGVGLAQCSHRCILLNWLQRIFVGNWFLLTSSPLFLVNCWCIALTIFHCPLW